MRQARLETNIQELERPSSRLQEHARQETLRELEFVKNVRKEGVNEDEFTVEGMGQHDFRTNSPDNKVVKFSEVIFPLYIFLFCNRTQLKIILVGPRSHM